MILDIYHTNKFKLIIIMLYEIYNEFILYSIIIFFDFDWNIIMKWEYDFKFFNSIFLENFVDH
jgi:hypothetical protein